MATYPSSSHPKTITKNNNVDTNSPTTSGTTFVQADPSNFRALVQKLTGASTDSSNHKLPVTYWTRESSGGLRDRKKLEMEMSKASPVWNLDFKAANGTMTSPRTAPMGREELEEKGIAEKGYYMHPTPPGCRGPDPPQLLPLFPLHHSHSST